MSNKVKGFTVILQHELSEQNAEHIKKAIELIKGVQLVTNQIVDDKDYLYKQKANADVRFKLWNFIEKEF
jgi:hypothetical protein